MTAPAVEDSQLGNGVLALWHDCTPGQERVFEQWYQHEHMHERLSIPGFIVGRRFEAIDAKPGYFTCYHVADPAVFSADAYRARAEDPTPLTRTIMTGGGITNMSRTVCRVAHRRGAMRGAIAVTAVLKTADAAAVFDDVLDDLSLLPGVARAESWINAEAPRANVSVEEQLRGGDDKVAGCLYVETLRRRDAVTVMQQFDSIPSGHIERQGMYRFLCDLDTQTQQVEDA